MEVVRRGMSGPMTGRDRPVQTRSWLRRTVLTRENLYALLLCLLLLALIIVTTDAAPTWIYQGF